MVNIIIKKYNIKDVYEWCKNSGAICLEDEYIGVKTPMKFLCPICGDEFYRTFENAKFRNDIHCKKCLAKKRGAKKKLSEKYVKEYIESKGRLLLSEYINIDALINIQCSCGEEYTTSFYSFKKNNKINCKTCTSKVMSENKAIDIPNLIEIVEKEGSVFIDRELCGKDQKILVDDGCGHKPYWIRLNKFRTGGRCPLCSNSKGEKRILKFLENNNVNYTREYSFDDLVGVGGNKLRFDFAIHMNDNYLILIEYDGVQHFKLSFNDEKSFDRTKLHDDYKNKYCKNNNIPLIRIPYYEFENIESILNNYI